MIDPTRHDLGRKVIYRDLNTPNGSKLEEGTITSFNDAYVFVRYHSGSTSAATRRYDLEWSTREPGETAISMTVAGGKVTEMDFCYPPEPPWLRT
ncbi:MAG TPA: hypothetical protein VK741_22940 [Acetobacteraceae bacterium]|nr:hypothetical protein [Acetobacteraceae bacterium]